MNTDPKTSAEAFKLYKRWEKALLAADIELPKGCSKMGFVAYCFAMAVHGTNGIDCYASDARICAELQIYNRRDIAKYRHAAVDLGWMIPNGRKVNRVESLNIAIPSPKVAGKSGRPDNPPAVERDPKPTAVEHDAWLPPATCPACQPLIALVEQGKMTVAEVEIAHDSG